MFQQIRVALLALCLVGCTHHVKSPPAEPLPPSQKPLSAEKLEQAKDFISKAIYHDGSLWVLSLGSILFRVDLDNKKVEVFPHARYVLDMYQNENNELFLLTKNGKQSTLQIVTSTNGSWSIVTTLLKKGSEGVLGFTQYKGSFLVLTEKKLYLQEDQSNWRVLPFKLKKDDKFGLRGQMPMAATDDGYLYLGLNKGEFGGGLLRISLKNGNVEKVEKANSEPITALVGDPEDPNAVLAAVGLRHFFEHGSLLRVTKNDVTVVFKKRYDYKTGEPQNPCDGKNEPGSAGRGDEAVFEIERDGKKVWLVTGRAVYSLAGGVIEGCTKLPDSINCNDGICAEEKIPGVILVASGIGSILAVGGTIPLIAIKR